MSMSPPVSIIVQQQQTLNYPASFQHTNFSAMLNYKTKKLILRRMFLLSWDCFLFCNTEIIENIWIISFLFISNQYTIEQLPDLIWRWYISLPHSRHATSWGNGMRNTLFTQPIFFMLPLGSKIYYSWNWFLFSINLLLSQLRGILSKPCLLGVPFLW